MIIGFVGGHPDGDSITLSSDPKKNLIRVVNLTKVLQTMDETHRNIAIIQDSYKKYILTVLESHYGSIMVEGNLILNEFICDWLLESGKSVVFNLKKYCGGWVEPYEELERIEPPLDSPYEVWINEFNDFVKKYGYSPHLGKLVAGDTLCMDSRALSQFYVNLKEIDYQELIEVITRKEDTTMLSMEESIRKAMMELGITPDNSSGEKNKPVKAQHPAQTQIKRTPIQSPENEVQENADISEKTEQFDGSATEDNEENSIFVKMTDTNMAILIPVGLKMQTQTIGGTLFNVANVQLPEFSSKRIQELQIVSQDSQQNPKPVPVESAKPKEDVSQSSDSTDELEELIANKAMLDKSIKVARADGDTEKVNELRKQRHVVRAKINRLKK